MPFTRRRLLVRTGALAAGSALARAVPGAAAPPPPDAPVIGPPPLTTAGYFALADRIQRRLNHTWHRERQAYSSGGQHIDAIYNAAILSVHAVAAELGHVGPARNDARARALVARLCASPPYVAARPPGGGTMRHGPGWLADLGTLDSPQDKAIDPKVAEGLFCAWRARAALALPPETVSLIADRINRVARGRFFRYPSVRLNQINWNAELYAYAAAVGGDPELLRRDYREQLRRFVAGVRRPATRYGTTNLGPGYRFEYLPHFPPEDPSNLDSAEYANITVHALSAYQQALDAGMAPLPEADLDILRAWVERVLCGSWLHCGMLNWDTGLGLARWMKSKTWAYAQQGLLAIARADHFHRDPAYGPWAKHIFDRGLGLYDRMLAIGETRRIPSAHLYGIDAAHQGLGSARMFSARIAANAARAAAAGLGAMAAAEPPPMYAFDADIGRLAVSTPRYGTAILASNRGALPYGGIELARLFDAAGRPVGGIGGRPPAAFGIVVRDSSGRRRLATQDPRRSSRIVLTRSPRGRVERVRRLPREPDAGPFADLAAEGVVRSRDAVVTTRHRFTRDFIETEWSVERRRGSPRVEALFPSWGRDAPIEALRADGSVVALGAGGAALPLAGVARFRVGAYEVMLLDAPEGVAQAVRVARQIAAPNPGPTLVIRLGRAPAALRVRVVLPANGGR